MPNIVYVDDDLQELIPGYLQYRAEDLMKLRELADQDNYDAIKSIAHTLKGNGGGYGFNEITRIAREMELALQEVQSKTIIVGLINELEDYLNDIEIVYYTAT